MVDGVCGLHWLVIGDFLDVTPPRTIDVSGSNSDVCVVALYYHQSSVFVVVVCWMKYMELVLYWVPHQCRGWGLYVHNKPNNNKPSDVILREGQFFKLSCVPVTCKLSTKKTMNSQKI